MRRKRRRKRKYMLFSKFNFRGSIFIPFMGVILGSS
jgi:hypothetical protein